jgi:alanyl-tRNA synthetase
MSVPRADAQIADEIKKYFAENPNENVFVGQFDIGGNPKVLAGAAQTGKTLSKAVYVFSPDSETGKVAHVNYLPADVLEKKVLDAKVWLGEVSKVIGGKGGGKPDSASGVGSETGKIAEAIETARKVFKEKVEGA